jgi:hypothetical protein
MKNFWALNSRIWSQNRPFLARIFNVQIITSAPGEVAVADVPGGGLGSRGGRPPATDGTRQIR